MNYNLGILLECLFLFLFNFVIVKMILEWRIMKCYCVDDFKKDYIFYFGIFYMCFILLFLAYPSFITTITGQTLSLVSVPFTIFYAYYLVRYIDELEKEQCNCVTNTNILVLKSYTYIFVTYLILGCMGLSYYFIKSREYQKILKGFINNNIIRKKIIIKKNK